MEHNDIYREDLFRFDYATYDIKKIIETVSQINELLLKVNPALAEKGISTPKRNANLPGLGMQLNK